MSPKSQTDQKPKSSEKLRYAFVSYLDGGLKKKVRSLQKGVYLLTGSKASLELWEPHLTIAPPVWLGVNELRHFNADIKRAISGIKPFEVQLSGFRFSSGGDSKQGSFVVSIRVKMNRKLELLTRKIMIAVKNKYQHDYIWPKSYKYHVTVSYRDLDKNGFEKAKEFFKGKQFSKIFAVNHLAVGREDKTGKVTMYREFNF